MPHSEIRGSKGARPSPRLFAACHVLLRLSVPRHPPNALTRLIRSPAAAHREQNPPQATKREPRSTTQHSSYTRLAVPSRRPARAKPPPKKKPSPNPRPATQTASRIPIHNVKDHRTEITAQRTEVLASRPRSNFNFPRTRSEAQSADDTPAPKHSPSSFSDLCSLSSRLLVEPTGIEPATSCLQSRRSPS